MEVKIPQEIETEDKIIGPLTLKQFLKLALGSGIIYLGFVYSRALGLPFIAFLIFALPVAIFFALLTFYKINEQPFEKYLLSVLAYYTKPQKRIWKRAPKKETPLVIEKKEESQKISPKKVTRSRIEELAYVLDTKGFVEKEETKETKEKEESSVIDEMKKKLIEKRSGAEEETYYKGLNELLPPSVVIPEHLKEEAEIVLKEPSFAKASEGESAPPAPKAKIKLIEPAVILKPEKAHLPPMSETLPASTATEQAQIKEELLEINQEKEKPQIIIEAPKVETKKPIIKRIIITMQEHLKEITGK